VKKRRIPDMPIEAIFLNPRLATLSPAPFGMVMRILMHYWFTECRPLPKAEAEICAIGRTHRSTWTANKAEILSILDELQDAIKARREQKAGSLARIRALAHRGAEVRRAARLERHQVVAREKASLATAMLSRGQSEQAREVAKRTDRQNPKAFVETRF
jgi:uncharacterized protein YdaU (DUF1376 family)